MTMERVSLTVHSSAARLACPFHASGPFESLAEFQICGRNWTCGGRFVADSIRYGLTVTTSFPNVMLKPRPTLADLALQIWRLQQTPKAPADQRLQEALETRDLASLSSSSPSAVFRSHGLDIFKRCAMASVMRSVIKIMHRKG